VDYPSMGKTVFHGVIAAIFWALWWALSDKFVAGELMFLLAGVFSFAFLVQALEYAIGAWVRIRDSHAEHVARVKAITPETELVRAFSLLSPQQAELYRERSARLKTIPHVAGPVHVFEVDGMNIPVEWVEDFFANSSEEGMRPERDYGEGTKGREWWRQMYKFYAKRQHVGPLVPGRRVKWRYGFNAALQWFFGQSGADVFDGDVPDFSDFSQDLESEE